MSTGKELVERLEKYAPSDAPNAKEYMEIIVKQVMGVTKSGNTRPLGDMVMFVQTSSAVGLDPLKRQIYPVYRWDAKQQKEVMTIQTGIDGFRVIANRTKEYGGSDEGKFEYREGVDDTPYKVSVTVYKINSITGERMPTTATARWSEYYPGEKQGFMWKKMPETMLEKCAEAKALRKAFPNDFSQIYVDEEMQQAPLVVTNETVEDFDNLIKEASTVSDLMSVFDSMNPEQKNDYTKLLTVRKKEILEETENADSN